MSGPMGSLGWGEGRIQPLGQILISVGPSGLDLAT